MNGKLSRDEAVSLITEERIKKLTAAERENILLDWWSIESDDIEYQNIPNYLRKEIAQFHEPTHPIDDRRYDDLIRVGLRAGLKGVKNSYLEACLLTEGVGEYIVYGQAELLEVCPCCRFRTLLRRGVYEVCPVCFWEDDGIDDYKQYSGPNHMTLNEGRETWARIGAVSEAALPYVLKDREARYYHE